MKIPDTREILGEPSPVEQLASYMERHGVMLERLANRRNPLTLKEASEVFMSQLSKEHQITDMEVFERTTQRVGWPDGSERLDKAVDGFGGQYWLQTDEQLVALIEAGMQQGLNSFYASITQRPWLGEGELEDEIDMGAANFAAKPYAMRQFSMLPEFSELLRAAMADFHADRSVSGSLIAQWENASREQKPFTVLHALRITHSVRQRLMREDDLLIQYGHMGIDPSLASPITNSSYELYR